MIESLLTAFSIGLLATNSPCVLPLYPGYLAYISGGQDAPRDDKTRYFLGLFVLLGVLSMMLALGALIAWLSISVGSALAWLVPFADLVIIALGVLLICNINPFKSLPQIRSPLLRHPLANAYFYGLLYGPITLPCSGPLVVSIFAYSFTAQEALGKLVVFMGFGLGFGLPLFILSLLSGAAQRWLVRFFSRHARPINLVGGLLLVGIGIYDLAANWSSLLLYWGVSQAFFLSLNERLHIISFLIQYFPA